MLVSQCDLPYLIRFVESDEAIRFPSGKRQGKPLSGFWMCWPGRTGMRESDGRLRRAFCITAVKQTVGLSVSRAIRRFAQTLGRKVTPTQLNRLRSDYYQLRTTIDRAYFVFGSQFLSWRAWVFESSEDRLQLRLSGRLTQTVKTQFAVRWNTLARQDECTA